MTDTQAVSVTDREVVMTRVFDAPRERVYSAYTDPAIIPHWWGQRDCTTTVDRSDVAPGGIWRYIVRGKDGNEYAFRGEYREVVPNERLVNTSEFEPMPGQVVVDTTEFEDVDGRTKVTVTSLFDSGETRKDMLDSGMEANANEDWDRLAEYLATDS